MVWGIRELALVEGLVPSEMKGRWCGPGRDPESCWGSGPVGTAGTATGPGVGRAQTGVWAVWPLAGRSCG